MLELNKLRNEIDEIDKKISDLIKYRQSLATKIVRAKKDVFPFDPKREKKLLKKIFNYGLDPVLTERIWRQIISFNLSRQKRMKIGILDNDKYCVAAFESCFGPYFESKMFKSKPRLLNALNNEKIEIAFLNKKKSDFSNKVYELENVSDFPSSGMFYKSKYSILIKKTEV